VDLDPLGLKLKREQLGMTQLELAIRAELTPATISRLENGHQAPNLRTCSALAFGLGISLVELIGSTMLVRPPRRRAS
jgi:transcriptional regulator with XRE-family HTH domain